MAQLPGARSAGRVQSVCLRLIVEREMEIEAFNPREYWSVKALLATPRGQEFEARLTVLGGQKLDKFSIETDTAAELAVQAITSRALTVKSVEAKPASRNPSPPLHDLDPATGSQPQIRHGRAPDHERGTTAL